MGVAFLQARFFAFVKTGWDPQVFDVVGVAAARSPASFD